MSYRKQWYTFGIRSRSAIELMPENALNNGDTVFNVDIDKPEYVYTPSYATNPDDRIWMNEDCVYVDDLERTSYIGNIVQVRTDDIFSGPGNQTTWVQKCGTGVPFYVGQFLGVVYRIPIGTDVFNPSYGRAVAIQGIYNVKFTSATTNVTAGNLAIISSTAGEASQTGSTASTGVIGVIMETKTLGVDKLAKVMIQSFSSK